MEFENHASGTAKAGLTTGIIGTSLGALNLLANGGGILGGLTGNNGTVVNPHNCMPMCSDDHLVNRYENAQQARIAELESQIALRDANTFTDQKILEVYKDYNARFNEIEKQIAAQHVQNQRTADSFQLTTERMEAMKKELCCCINNERQERQCADNSIVNYVNATFYPKMVADVTTGSTTTPQTTYNPLPAQNCDCGPCCC